MAAVFNEKTKKYDVNITIPSFGIKKPQKKQIGSFETKKEAMAAVISAKKTLKLIIPRVPTNEEINRWIATKMS